MVSRFFVMDPEAHKKISLHWNGPLVIINKSKRKKKRSTSIDIEKPFKSNRLIGSLTSIGVRKEKLKKHVLFVDIQICWRSWVLRLLLDRNKKKLMQIEENIDISRARVANLFIAFFLFAWWNHTKSRWDFIGCSKSDQLSLALKRWTSFDNGFRYWQG